MNIKENLIYQLLSVVLIIGIVILVVDVIIPKYTPRTPERIIKEIDFSNSSWIEEYVEQSVGLFGKDFLVNTAFTYNIRSNKMIVTYASQNSVEEAREYYLTLPGAVLSGRNDQTSLNITAQEDGQALRVYNYYSSVSRVFEVELTLAPDRAEQVISQLEAAFPEGAVAGMPEIQELLSGDPFGGYVRYRYDHLDELYQPYLPIFSRAYLYSGTEEDFQAIMAELIAAYPDYKFNETQNTHYFRIQDKVLSIGNVLTDAGENVVSISVQQTAPGN